MTDSNRAIRSSQRLRALPAQLIETPDGVILKRGFTALKIQGEGSAAALAQILGAAAAGATREDIGLGFEETDRDAVDQLVEQLFERRILVPAAQARSVSDESSVDVFYWNFGSTATTVAERLNQRRIAIIGVNQISSRLASGLATAGVTDYSVVDFQLLRNLQLFDENGCLSSDGWEAGTRPPVDYGEWAASLDSAPPGCVVLTSAFGAIPAVREWNRHCVEQNWHFLPVLLWDLVGQIGPLVIPGETACYECLRARQNSHMENPQETRAAENEGFPGQLTNSFHPSMTSVLGELAQLELTKFYSGCLPSSIVGSVIEVNLMKPSVVTRRVLKIPRCSACGKMATRSSSALDASTNVRPE
jgi:molybdopterin-synthase adenylyltransferase